MPTTHERRAGEQAQDALDEGCDLIAALGGDGTINEALQAVADSSATLLPLPGGTANVLARELGLGLNPVKVAESVPSLESRAVPLGAVEFGEPSVRRLFLLMCGAGLDANAVYDLDASLKRKVGILAYIWSGLGQIVRPLRPVEVTLDGDTLVTGLVVVSKSKLYGGGLTLTPDAHLLADAFDVVCFPLTSPLTYTWYLLAVLTGNLDRVSNIVHRPASTVDLHSSAHESVPVQIDGELVGSLPARVVMGPERLNLLGPAAYWRRNG
jgi:diacylglycerol kinase (ATP)